MDDPVLSHTVVHHHLCHEDDCYITPRTNKESKVSHIRNKCENFKR